MDWLLFGAVMAAAVAFGAWSQLTSSANFYRVMMPACVLLLIVCVVGLGASIVTAVV